MKSKVGQSPVSNSQSPSNHSNIELHQPNLCRFEPQIVCKISWARNNPKIVNHQMHNSTISVQVLIDCRVKKRNVRNFIWVVFNSVMPNSFLLWIYKISCWRQIQSQKDDVGNEEHYLSGISANIPNSLLQNKLLMEVWWDTCQSSPETPRFHIANWYWTHVFIAPILLIKVQ